MAKATKEQDVPQPIYNRPVPVEKERPYYIVNPAGAVHSVSRAEASNLLRRLGYRMAKREEIARYHELDVQDFRRPIAPRWTPDPDVAPQLD